MAWWSWAMIGYVGLNLVLVAGLMAVCGITELRSRRQGRRLVHGAERFLTEAALPVGATRGAR